MPPHPGADCPPSKTGEHVIVTIRPYIEVATWRQAGAYDPFCVFCGRSQP